MSSKKKLALSITTLAIVLIAMIGMTVAVFAANQVAVTSSIISVTYEPGANVIATVSATVNGNAMVKQGTNETSISFVGSEAENNSQALVPASNPSFTWDNTDNAYIITFVYSFTNNNSDNTKKLVATLTTADGETGTTNANNEVLRETNASTHSVEILAGQTETYTIVYKVSNTGANATLNKTFSWNLQSIAVS